LKDRALGQGKRGVNRFIAGRLAADFAPDSCIDPGKSGSRLPYHWQE
jgi:hypothetical protein